MKEIPLTQGKVALVDAADFDWLNQWKWCALASRTKNGLFYAVRNPPKINGKRIEPLIRMHRVILGLACGDPREGDHKEPTATLDNRRSNLRVASSSQNSRNTRLGRRNTSGFKGVCFIPKYHKWQAAIRVNKRSMYLGQFNTAAAAAEAYAEAARFYYGEFARTA